MLTSLRLQSFRSYKDESLEFGPRVNIVVGPNASGKTNLLEGILIIATGRSYRTNSSNLIRNDQTWARLESNSSDGHCRVVKFQKTIQKTPTKSFVIDEKPYSRLGLKQSLPLVLFEPNDLQLLNNDPSARRDYLDDLLEQLDNNFHKTRTIYRRALSQRNRLLKGDWHYARENLFAWNIRLSELGGQIVALRLQLIETINNRLSATYSRIADEKTELKATYQSNLNIDDYANSMQQKLQSSTEVDLQRGFTGAGPHRDDILITIGGHPAVSNASRGEIRTIMLALKMMEMELIELLHNKEPLLLLDDVFSELDGKRRKALTRVLQNYQTFITTTDADVVVQHFTDDCTIIPTTKS